MTDITEHHSKSNRSPLDELIGKYTALPEWLDMNHPESPHYFELVVFDENGKVTRWFERKPTQKDIL